MSEEFPQNNQHSEPKSPEAWEREALRENVRERLLWLKPNDQEGFRALVHAMAVDSGYTLSEGNDILDLIVDNSAIADNVADMLEISTELLILKEKTSKEEFLSRIFNESNDVD